MAKDKQEETPSPKKQNECTSFNIVDEYKATHYMLRHVDSNEELSAFLADNCPDYFDPPEWDGIFRCKVHKDTVMIPDPQYAANTIYKCPVEGCTFIDLA